jgi:tRNA-2-methylthio-N6-dimethylallyladenosine synthase
MAFSSDFIVGHPGESDDDFADTLALVRDVGFAQAYSFKYSPRPGTPAAIQTGQIAEAVKSERLTILQELLNQQQHSFNKASINRRVPVLFDRPGKRPGQLLGRTPHLQSVHAEMPESMFGEIVDLTITAATAISLSGELTKAADANAAASLL